MVTLRSTSLSSLVIDVVRPETTNSNPNSPTSTSTPLMFKRRKVERIFPVYARGKLSPTSDPAVNWGSVVGDSIWDADRVEAKCQVACLLEEITSRQCGSESERGLWAKSNSKVLKASKSEAYALIIDGKSLAYALKDDIKIEFL
ncbi:hypothetical protein L2E82_39921 [Cichorium intybus]|uniref:Uncharacterized protein n=1 Tax=Cichorium intybus TaxID=13427 RepID=A0ACB9AJ16_CICIN|nr:hypothetical protein L2E82_39921 [Cichorium intybus]